MKGIAHKSSEMGFHLYFDHINDELKSYLPYILALVHSSKTVLLPSGATLKRHYAAGLRARHSGQPIPVFLNNNAATLSNAKNICL